MITRSAVLLIRLVGVGLLGLVAVLVQGGSGPVSAQDGVPTFKVHPPGVLRDNWGVGIKEDTLYAPGMTFPVKAPTTLNSQIRGKGGMFNPGDQCAGENYNEVWWDTYCEKRGASGRSSICGSGAIHQGLDIRGGTTETCTRYKRTHETTIEAVAAYDGTIVKIGSFSVDLDTDRHGSFRYLHLDMARLKVRRGDRVRAGQTLGYLASDFGSAGKNATTQHLHLEHRVTLNGAPPRRGFKPVPLYCDMVLAYERTGRTAVPVGGGLHCPIGGVASKPTPGTPSGPVAGTDQAPPSGGGGGGTDGGAGGGALGGGAPVGGAASRYSSLWSHGGSTVGLVSSGPRRAFEYLEPRRGLPDLVKPGTVLFDGTKSGEGYSGRAFVFSERCGAQAYDVAGPVDRGGERVVLKGQRPVPGPQGCEAARFYPDTLVFNFKSAAGTPASPQPTGPEVSGGGAGSGTGASPGSGTGLGTASPPIMGPQVTTGGQIVKACTRDSCVDRNAYVAQYADLYRREQGGKRLNVYQEAAINAVINVWDTTPDLENLKRLAYILATVYHESFHLIYPIRECKCVDDAGSVACVRKLHARGIATAYHRRHPRTRQSYYGRGQTQLTLHENFSKITDKLGLRAEGVDLFADPDASLQLDISARNAALGLYHGWYRHPHRLKTNPFETQFDWLRARDVLISQRRHADRVAAHGQAIYRILSQSGMLISRAAFEARYAKPVVPEKPPVVVDGGKPEAPAQPPEVVDTGKPEAPAKPPLVVEVDKPEVPAKPPVVVEVDKPEAPTMPPVVVDQQAPVAPPAAPPSQIDTRAIGRIASEIAALEKATGDLQALAADLNKRATRLKVRIDDLVEESQPATASAAKSAQRRSIKMGAEAVEVAKAAGPTSGNVAEGVLDPAVDFKSKWPASHKPLGKWCDASPADRKAARKLLAVSDPEDVELMQRYSAPVFAPEGQGAGAAARSKSATGGVDFRLSIGALSPARPGSLAEASGRKSAARPDASTTPAFWDLPLIARATGSARTIPPKGPERP